MGTELVPHLADHQTERPAPGDPRRLWAVHARGRGDGGRGPDRTSTHGVWERGCRQRCPPGCAGSRTSRLALDNDARQELPALLSSSIGCVPLGEVVSRPPAPNSLWAYRSKGSPRGSRMRVTHSSTATKPRTRASNQVTTASSPRSSRMAFSQRVRGGGRVRSIPHRWDVTPASAKRRSRSGADRILP